MEKVTKTYVEKLYRGFLFNECLSQVISERNPMLIENDGKMQGFRFYDEEYVVDGETTYQGRTSNYSSWIFFGRRYSYDEIMEMYGNNPNYSILIDNMQRNHFDYVCQTQVGTFLPMGEGDMTFDEYVSKNEKSKAKTKVKSNKHEQE